MSRGRNDYEGIRKLMRIERNRLYTLNDWRPKARYANEIFKANKFTLATAGFYHDLPQIRAIVAIDDISLREENDLRDAVLCFACNLICCDWKPDFVPMESHELYSPDCPFVLGHACGNVPSRRPTTEMRCRETAVATTAAAAAAAAATTTMAAAESRNTSRPRYLRQEGVIESPQTSVWHESPLPSPSPPPSYEEAVGEIQRGLESLRTSNTARRKAKFPHMACLVQRIESFASAKTIPRSSTKILANYGFYLDDTTSCVQCYFCGAFGISSAEFFHPSVSTIAAAGAISGDDETCSFVVAITPEQAHQHIRCLHFSSCAYMAAAAYRCG